MLRIKVLLPKCTEKDTVKRIFVQSLNDCESLPIPKNQPEMVFESPEGMDIELRLIDVDARGRCSEPLIMRFNTDYPPPDTEGMKVRIESMGPVIEDTVVPEQESEIPEQEPKIPEQEEPKIEEPLILNQGIGVTRLNLHREE